MSLFQHKKYLFLLVIFLSGNIFCFAQRDAVPIGQNRISNTNAATFSNVRNPNQAVTKDSLEKRDKHEDSITISYRYADRIGTFFLDSTVNDFYSKFHLKAADIYLGNIGTAARSIIFSPSMQPGWDHGFHSFDVYMKKTEDARYFTTTRPYTELGYILANRTEQTINLMHTQNIKPNWSVAAEYQLLSSPGYYQNLKTQNSAYLINSYYQGKKKRYAAYFAMAGNRINVFENGGIRNDTFLTSSSTRFLFDIPVNLGDTSLAYRTSFFGNDNVSTGNQYKNFHAMFRQQYDLGKRDSLVVNDTSVVYLFYPRLRIQYQVDYSSFDLKFVDMNWERDSLFFKNHYEINLQDTLLLRDKWSNIVNDLSIYQFPYAKNPNQYIKVGAAVQNLHGRFYTNGTSSDYYNVILHGEYRNRTRNKKWDIDALGTFYLNGLNAGDYSAALNLRRVISRRSGYLELGFQNVNKSPSFLYEGASSFSVGNVNSFNKQNITRINIGFSLPEAKFKMEGNYYAITNYLYLSGFKQRDQETGLFNVLVINAEKQFKLSKKWNWYSQVVVQKTLGNAPLNLPLVWTRNRLAFEGRFYKNLNLSTGIELKYHTSFKADNYSPALGSFFYQDGMTINNRPDITAFLHFRIRSFNAFIRAENLNSARFAGGGFNWNNVNTAAPLYHYPGYLLRVGIVWWFVN